MLKQLFYRLGDDLKELFSGIWQDPFAAGRGRRWERDFSGEVGPLDVRYAIFLVVLTILPAIFVCAVSTEPQTRALAQLFGAPAQAVISGFLTSALVFLGSHLNRVQRSYSFAFKLMLRIMAVYPILEFLTLSHWGPVLILVFYGCFVIRGVRKSYAIPLRNALLFFGVAYTAFALLQIQAVLQTLQ